MDTAPAIATQIEMKVIDLETFTIQKKSLSGHIGYTPSDKAFYLYLDVSGLLYWISYYHDLVGDIQATILRDFCSSLSEWNHHLLLREGKLWNFPYLPKMTV